MSDELAEKAQASFDNLQGAFYVLTELAHLLRGCLQNGTEFKASLENRPDGTWRVVVESVRKE